MKIKLTSINIFKSKIDKRQFKNLLPFLISTGFKKYINNMTSIIKKLVSQEQVLNSMIALLTAVLIFHTLVLTGVISYAIVWAGKISNAAAMRKLEVISILVNAFSILTLLLKAGY